MIKNEKLVLQTHLSVKFTVMNPKYIITVSGADWYKSLTKTNANTACHTVMCIHCIRDVHLMTEADTIHISMLSQRYDTLKVHMKQLPMRYDSPLFTMQCDPISIRFDLTQCDSMQYDAMEKI